MANVSKNVRLAKRTLENTGSIQELVEDNILDAVAVMVESMKDTSASASARQSAAKEIIRLHWIFQQATEQLAGDASNREEERKQEVGKSTVALFQRTPLSNVI